MKIADLFAEVGFKFDSIKLREVTKLIGDLNISSIVGATSLVALGEGIKNLIETSSQVSSNLATLKENTGIDTKFAQQFEAASDALGSSKEAADGLINSLSKIRQDIKFGGSVPRGLALMGINAADIMGPEENLLAKVNKILSQKPPLSNQSQREAYASFLSSINRDLGATPDLLKALSDPNLFSKMKEFGYLTQSDIQANVIATYQWKEAVHNVNIEFMKTADQLLPAITSILKSFNDNGGLKAVANTLKFISDEIYKAALLFGAIKNYAQAGLMDIGSAASQPLINQARLGNELRKDFSTPITSVKVSVAPISITTNNPQEFGKKFEEAFTKALNNATSQFGLGQT